MQYMVVFLADISKKYYLCRYNVTIKLADRWKTNTIGVTDEAINVDDIIETTNHFRAVDYIIQENNGKLTETYIKQLHFILKSGTSEERKEMFYYNGLRHWPHIKGYLADTCLTAQDHFKVLLENTTITKFVSVLLPKIYNYADIFRCPHQYLSCGKHLYIQERGTGFGSSAFRC